MECNAMMFGPWGGNGGKPWDTLETQGITRIKIYYGDAIYGLDITYVIDAKRQTLCVGGTGGNLWNEIILAENEYFDSISGFYGLLGQVTVIKQLNLKTNMGRHVTVGKMQEGDSPFPYSPPPLPPSPPYKIVGFFGCASTALDAIGIYCYRETKGKN